MRFRTLLIHRCELLTQLPTGEQDEYGRDIVENILIANVPCRFDQVRQRAVADETGTDFLYENVLYFDKDYGISLDVEISNISDKKGNLILSGSFSVVNILPIFDRAKLHHYEVVVKRK